MADIRSCPTSCWFQFIIPPPPTVTSDAYEYQTKKLPANSRELYNMTHNEGSLLQVSWTSSVIYNLGPSQIGRYAMELVVVTAL